MKICLDLMGGDYVPKSALEGALLACDELETNVRILLLGDLDIVSKNYKSLFDKLTLTGKVDFINCPEVIEMNDLPTKAFTLKPNSSIAIGFKMLKKNESDVFIGAGNSGAMMVGSIYAAKVIEGIIRPAIASMVPKENGNFGIIIDVGVNPDARQDALFQFGIMGSAYLKSVFKINNPRVGLLNIGSEKEKGNLVTQAAYSLMEGTDKFNFVGNIEGYDILADKADVLVCDGFTGNMIIKTFEGIYHILKKKGIKDSYFDSFNYELYGGTPILGINKPVIVGHGKSNPVAFKNMISHAEKIVRNDLISEIKNQIVNLNNYQ